VPPSKLLLLQCEVDVDCVESFCFFSVLKVGVSEGKVVRGTLLFHTAETWRMGMVDGWRVWMVGSDVAVPQSQSFGFGCEVRLRIYTQSTTNGTGGAI
jgi:hypothetical protein